MEKINKIYVIHYEKLKERKKYLKNRLNELNLTKKTEWIIQKENFRINKKLMKKIYKNDLNIAKNKLNNFGNHEPRELTFGELALSINHLKVWNKIVKSNSEFSLVLEDDVILENDFIDKLEKINSILNKNHDIVYTDYGYHSVSQKNNINNYKFEKLNNTCYSLRTTGSYIISKDYSKILSSKIFPITTPIDLEMRLFEIKNKIQTYWLNGYLTYQGSIYKIYQNSLKTDIKTKKIKNLTDLRHLILTQIEGHRFEKKIFWKILIRLKDYLRKLLVK